MRSRADDPEDLDPRRLRKWRLGESSVAVVLALLTAGSSALYTKFQTDQNTKDIEAAKEVQAQLWKSRDADKQVIDDRLRRIEEKLDVLIGESHTSGHR